MLIEPSSGYIFRNRARTWTIGIPDDWQSQNIQQPNNPQTVEDMLAAINATVIKQGIADIVFHPHGWSRSEQIAEECIERINKNLLLDQPLRRTVGGGDNGVRIVDLNLDGFLDVMIGNEQLQVARVWDPDNNQWNEIPSPVEFVTSDANSNPIDQGVQFGQLTADEGVSMLVNNEQDQSVYQFADNRFVRKALPIELLPYRTSRQGVNQGVRLRDVDVDGTSEIIVANPEAKILFQLASDGKWTPNPTPFPFAVVDAKGADNGLRFVDLDKDGYDDLVISNASEKAVRLYAAESQNFTRIVEPIDEIPLIVRGETNNGAWFADDHMWVQNEDTNRLPDGVDRRTFSQLTGTAASGPSGSE